MQSTDTDISAVAIRRVDGIDREGRVLLASQEDGPATPSRVAWMRENPDWEECRGMRVVVGYEGGDPDAPIILGFLDSPATVRETSNPAAPSTIKIESEEELVLECGKAKISLRADGRISILGGYLVSRSTGVNKIKGGSVQIN